MSAQQTTSAIQTNDSIPANNYDSIVAFSRPGNEHAWLGRLAGNWTFRDKNISAISGTLTRTSLYSGRFFLVKMSGGKIPMPLPRSGSKMVPYESMTLEGYDNVTRKFILATINDHLGSDIQNAQGTLDPDTGILIYTWTSELIPGTLTLNRKELIILDRNRFEERYFEITSGKEEMTRDLLFTRVQ